MITFKKNDYLLLSKTSYLNHYYLSYYENNSNKSIDGYIDILQIEKLLENIDEKYNLERNR